MKVEAGRASGAASCAKRLLRRSKSLAPAKPLMTFGSDLTGTAVTLPDPLRARGHGVLDQRAHRPRRAAWSPNSA